MARVSLEPTRNKRLLAVRGSSIGSDVLLSGDQKKEKGEDIKNARTRRSVSAFTTEIQFTEAMTEARQRWNRYLLLQRWRAEIVMVLCRRARGLDYESDATVLLPAFFSLFPTYGNFFAIANG